jgi:predicted dehydrogenase
MLNVGFINASLELSDYQKVIKEHNLLSFAGHFDSALLSSGDRKNNDDSLTSGVGKLISGCDAIIMPRVDHADFNLIVEALKKTKHILLGNPLMFDQDEMDHLFKLAEEADVIIKVMQSITYYDALQTAADYIRNPAYLEVRIDSADPHRSIFDAIFHAIQPVVFINHSNLKKLYAVSIPIDAHHPGMINARVEFDNGCVANITSSKFADTDRFYCRVHQENQDIRVDFLNHKVTLIGNDNTVKIRQNDYLRDELEQFAGSIQSRNHLINQSESGYLTYLIARKIMEKISLETISA